jgi:hypothetical protein
MAQILDPIPADRPGHILCCYVNATSKIQIARISNIPNWYFERVVFPGQRLVFEAFSEAVLEIHCGMMASAILSDKIPCTRLQIVEDGDLDAEPPDGEAGTSANTQAPDNSTDNPDGSETDSFSSPTLTSV